MVFGREKPAKDLRVERTRKWVRARSPLALVAGLLGGRRIIKRHIFFPIALAAIIVGIYGLRDICKHPERLGKRLCILGIVGGTIGLLLAFTLHFILPLFMESSPATLGG